MHLSAHRRAAGLALACTAAMVLAACSSGSTSSTGNTSSASPGGGNAGTPVVGGTLTMLGSGDVDYMDPNITYYSIGYLGMRPWTRQLFTYPADPSKQFTAVPDLATEMPTTSNGGISKDGKTYTIHIRSGADWNSSPPRQVTAADEVRGVKRTCNPQQPFGGIPDFATLIQGYQTFCNGFAKVAKTPSAIANYINNTPLPGVVAKNDTTVQFKLTSPATYFVDMLTMPAFSPAPVEVLKYLPASTELADHELSDGPYQLQSWVPTKSITFTRNPAWKASTDPVRKAYVDEIDVNETVTQDSTQQQLQTGSADMEWDNFPPPSSLPQLMASNDPNLNLGQTASSNPYVVFNMVSPNNNKAMANLKFRQALEYGINRDAILQVLGGPKVDPPLTHVLPSNILGSKDINLYPYDPTKAKQLLSESGVSNPTVKILYRNSSEGSSKTFQTIQQDLTQIGINVEGVTSPNADFYAEYREAPSVAPRGAWDRATAGWAADWYGDGALSFFNPLFSGKPSFPPIGSNFGFYNSPATNSLINQAITAKTADQAKTLWGQADEQVMKDAPFFPITQPTQPNYHATQVHNAIYVPEIQNFDPTNVWLSSGS